MPRHKIRDVQGLLAVLVASTALAQTATVRVEVVSGDTPVAGANVAIGAVSLLTGADGRASANVAFGDIPITATREGFLPARTSLLVTEARLYTVTFDLEPEETVEEEITVFATRSDRRIQDSALRVEVLQREEIEEKMLMTPGDIVMMLNEMGGMRVQTTSPSLGAASVRVQGMQGRYTQFLSDGLPLFGQQGAGLGLLQIPPMDLGQVEVIKGMSSALYGAGAMAGVVNLISRRPAEQPIREFLFNRTTRGGTDVSAFLGSRLSDTWGTTLLGGGHFQQKNDIDGDGWADLAGYQRAIARPRFYWDDGKGSAALLTGGVILESRSGGTVPGARLPAANTPYDEGLDTRRFDLGGSFQTTISNRFVLSSRVSASRLSHGHVFGEIREDDRHGLLFGEIALRGTYGKHTWVIGTAVTRDAYRSRDVPRFNYTFVAPGVFVQDDYDLTSWLSLSGSARADFHSAYGTFFSPRVSALVRGGGWTGRVSGGQGFFAPTPLTEDSEAAGLTRLGLPRPLREERGRSVSADLTRNLGPVSVTTTFFATTIDRPLRVTRDERYEVVNLDEAATNRGLELLGTWRRTPFSITGSYTYVRSRQVELAGRASEVPLTPRHSAGVVGVWERERTGRLGVEFYYTGRQQLEFNPYRATSEPYLIVGVMGERRLGRNARVFLNLENLTNVRQTRWNSLLLPQRAPDGRWTVDAWAPLDGRVVNGGVRFMF